MNTKEDEPKTILFQSYLDKKRSSIIEQHNHAPRISENKARFITEERKQYIKTQLTNELTRAEQLIVILYYYEEMSIKEIAAKLDLSESCVSRMRSSIIQRLGNPPKWTG